MIQYVHHAGVVHRLNASFPSLRGGFDSLRPLHIQKDNRDVIYVTVIFLYNDIINTNLYCILFTRSIP